MMPDRQRMTHTSPTPHIEDVTFPPPRDFGARRRIRSASRHASESKTTSAHRKGGTCLVVIAAIAFTMASIALFAGFGPLSLSSCNSDGGGTHGDSPVSRPDQRQGLSTPKSEWRKGRVPMLFQTDPAWANEPYAGSDIATSGCGPVCLSMVYIALTGKTDFGPIDMAIFSEKNGFVQNGMTAWALMTDGASALGLTSTELPASETSLVEALEKGNPVIASMLPGDFTTVGHFIVITGVDDNGRLYVHDPNSAQRSSATWDAATILSQCANLWAFSDG